MQNFYFYTFYFLFFIFLFFCFGGWAQLSPKGLGWTQPARPGHWPKPVTGRVKTDEARVEWLHACIMHSAKVINLPSHRATLHSN
jgi:hypothetical protein